MATLMSNASLIAAVDAMAILHWTWIVLKVAIGLGAVIFVHELGHFLVAKACGVKCEKFFVGFDIGGYKISRRWGETEYGIGILPLGGYVKMLGQDDDPAHIAEQMQKSQVEAASADAVQITGPKGEKYYVDRRSYLAKSVPQRMAIISAGVIMNVIFAFIFAVIAYGMGVPYQPCIVSETVPGAPAWVAGIEPGDEITKIGNRQNPTFMQLKGGVTLASQEDGIPCRVRRAATGEEVDMTLTPDRGRGRLATIGILVGPSDLTLQKDVPTVDESPAARAKLVAPAAADVRHGEAKLQGGDEIIRVGDIEVSNYREFAAELARLPDQPLQITVKRTKNQPKSADTAAASDSQELTFEVKATPMKRYGLVMKMGPVTAVQIGSPAKNAGLAAGDVIEAVDGQPMIGVDGATDTWDAVTLPEYLEEAATARRDVVLTVARPSAAGADPERVTITITPRVPTTFRSVVMERVPMSAEAAGFAYSIANEVVAILPDSPAAAADIRPGDAVTEAKFILPERIKGQAPEPFELNSEKPNWPAVFAAVQLAPEGTEVEFTVAREDAAEPHKVKLSPQPVDGHFVAERGFMFQPLKRIRYADSFAQQLQYGWDETASSLLMVYRFLDRLGDEVPLTALGGPGTIAMAAGGAASQGLSTLLIFLTLLSANLAVINFLPIPLLDGGHMVFLAYEGIRGRPANQLFVVAMHIVGFVFIISLMIFVIGLDIGWIPRGF